MDLKALLNPADDSQTSTKDSHSFIDRKSHSLIERTGHSRSKRKRTSPDQLVILNSVFQASRYPSTEKRQELAVQLGMSPRAVQIWFQNKRQNAKVKEEEAEIFGNVIPNGSIRSTSS